MKLINTIYLNPRWGSIQEEKEGGISEVFCMNTENGQIKYPFIKRYAGEVNKNIYYDIVTARGECGPIVLSEKSSELYIEFNEMFQKYCEEQSIIAEYIRFDPWNTNAKSFNKIYTLSAHGFAYCHRLQEDFFMTQYSSKRRNQIRKAQKSNVEIDTDVKWDRIGDFLELYKFTKEKHDVSSYYNLDKDFINRYKEELQNNVKLGLAYYQGKIIAGGLFLNGGDIYHYHFSASDPDFLELNAISLLLFEEAKKGAELGCSIMDLGGATPGGGLEKFKISMVKNDGIIPCFVGTKIRNKSAYDALVEQNGSAQEGYFPAYRSTLNDKSGGIGKH